jgi:hypothetical protein
MIEMLPIDLIVEIGILAGPDEYEQIAQTSKRNAIILQKPYITRATSALYRTEFRYKGCLHSFNDQPAIFTANEKYWYKYDLLHRDNDQPAMITVIGLYWFRNGKLHRDNDQPAVIYVNGQKEWYHHGNRIK